MNYKAKLKFYLNNSILKNVATLISGTIIAQLILVSFQLILRRVFSPEIFGSFAVYMGIAGVLIILSTLRYELAVVLPKEERKSNSLVVGGILISFLINLIVLIIILLFNKQIAAILNFPQELAYWLHFLPLSVFLMSTYQLFNYWLTRKSAFKSIAINKAFRRLSEGVSQSGLGVLAIKTGLIIGEIIGNIVNVFAGIYQAKKNGFTVKTVSIKKIKSSLKRYRNFPKYQSLPAVINTISLMLPVIIINKFFSTDDAGFFDLSKQILSVPIALVTASLSQVLLKDFSDKINKNLPLTKSVFKMSGLLLLIILPFMLVIIFFGKEIFGFIFSSTWAISGHYAALLVPAFAIQFIVSPVSICFAVLEKLKLLALWQVGYFFLIALLLFLTYLPIDIFLQLYTGIVIFAYSVYFLMIISICKKYDNTIKQMK